MKNLLVPCDFSEPAINAYRFALDVAAKSNGTVFVLNVVELPTLYDTTVMPALYFEKEALHDLMKKAHADFEKMRKKYKHEDVKVVFKSEFGLVHQMISHYTKKHDIDLIIMGSHGASGFRETFIGSNAERVVRWSPVPVLILKDFYKGPVKNIIFPNALDLDHQEELMRKVKALQNFFDATLHVVWINTPADFTSDVTTNQRLNKFAKRFMLVNYTLNIFNHTDQESGIIEFANFMNADLVAMGTHGRTGIAHFINGSVAEDVTNHHSGLVWTYSMIHKKALAEA